MYGFTELTLCQYVTLLVSRYAQLICVIEGAV